jgi:AcrR family transcriptional regulator
MAQTLKDATQARIARAALGLFAARGYEGTTMEAIARRARVSAGNIYRYHRSKQLLFGTLIDDAFVDACARALGLRGATAAAWPDRDGVRFLVDNRLRARILLGGARGSRWDGFAARRVAAWARRARTTTGGERSLRADRVRGRALAQAYRGYVAALVEILGEAEPVEEALAAYTRYHRAGITALVGAVES